MRTEIKDNLFNCIITTWEYDFIRYKNIVVSANNYEEAQNIIKLYLINNWKDIENYIWYNPICLFIENKEFNKKNEIYIFWKLKKQPKENILDDKIELEQYFDFEWWLKIQIERLSIYYSWWETAPESLKEVN